MSENDQSQLEIFLNDSSFLYKLLTLEFSSLRQYALGLIQESNAALVTDRTLSVGFSSDPEF